MKREAEAAQVLLSMISLPTSPSPPLFLVDTGVIS